MAEVCKKIGFYAQTNTKSFAIVQYVQINMVHFVQMAQNDIF